MHTWERFLLNIFMYIPTTIGTLHKITRFYRKYNRENLEMMIKEERNKVAFHKLVFDLCKQNYDI